MQKQKKIFHLRSDVFTAYIKQKRECTEVFTHIKRIGSCCFAHIGSIEIVINDGKETESVMLDDPTKGLILYPGLWREMIWHQNESVLCVAASEYYDPNEYIRDYDEFVKYVNCKGGKDEV